MSVAAARAALWEMSRSLFHDDEHANATIDAFATAVREEALDKAPVGLPEVMRIINGALAGDVAKVRAYAEMLAEKRALAGHMAGSRIRDVLAGVPQEVVKAMAPQEAEGWLRKLTVGLTSSVGREYATAIAAELDRLRSCEKRDGELLRELMAAADEVLANPLDPRLHAGRLALAVTEAEVTLTARRAAP